MRNLLEETKICIANSGHVSEDIVYIGSKHTGHKCTWEQFCTLADRDYQNLGENPAVMDDLIIVFSDGQTMWRAFEDDNEYWEYSEKFWEPATTREITSLFCIDYPSAPVNFTQLVRENQ